MTTIQQRFATLAPYVSKRGDWDAFLTLGTDNLAKIVILPAILVGIVMVIHAFQAVPWGHGVAIAIAMVPHIADLLKKQLDGTLLEIFEKGSTSSELMARLADNQGVYLQSYGLLSRGAIITGLLWGSIVAFLVDRDLRRATLFSLLATVLSLVGLIHAERIGLSLTPVTAGYLILTAILALFYFVRFRSREAEEGDATDVPPQQEHPAAAE